MSFILNAVTIINRHKNIIVTREQGKGGILHTDRATFVAVREFAKARGMSLIRMTIILLNLGMYLFLEVERAMMYSEAQKRKGVKEKESDV